MTPASLLARLQQPFSLLRCALLAQVLIAVMLPAVVAAATDHASPLLKNRFRLDHGIDEVSLIIYRQKGSAPAILVRPDGSKLYASRHGENVHWHDDLEFDLITISKPMPGPWQVVGTADPRNRIEILSDVQLKLDNNYETLYSGERIKLTARVENKTRKLELAPFIRDLKLDIWARPKSMGDDLALDVAGLKLATYIDDGTDLDEIPGDGVFTGNLQVSLAEGQFDLIFKGYNPTFARQLDTSLRVLPPPATIELISDNERTTALGVIVRSGELQPGTIAFSGEVSDANGTVKQFSAEGAQTRISLEDIVASGDYKVKATLYATTPDGREIMLTLAEKRFNLVGKGFDPAAALAKEGISVAESEQGDTQLQQLVGEVTKEFHTGVETLRVLKQPQPEVNWWLVIGANAALLAMIIGGIVVVKLRTLKTAKQRAEASLAGKSDKKAASSAGIDLILPED